MCMGRMAQSWWRGLAGVVQKAPMIHLTTVSWTCWRVMEKAFWPLYQMRELYVRTGRQMVLYARCQLPWSRPHTEFPSSWRAFRVPQVCIAIMLMCRCQLNLWFMNSLR